MVVDCLEGSSGVIVWNVQFARTANNWEMDEFSALYSLLYSKVLMRGEEDKMIWWGSKNGVFSVKSMSGIFMRGSAKGFPWCQCWKNSAPSRVSLFGRLLVGKF